MITLLSSSLTTLHLMEEPSALCLQISALLIASCFLIPQEKDYKNISLHFAGNKACKQIGNNVFVSSLASCCTFCRSRSHNLISP